MFKLDRGPLSSEKWEACIPMKGLKVHAQTDFITFSFPLSLVAWIGDLVVGGGFPLALQEPKLRIPRLPIQPSIT